MERIPVEVLVLIFDRLPIGQLDECRRVCKRWHFTIENLMEFDCLVVYRERQPVPVNQRLFHTGRSLSLHHSVCVDTVDLSEFKKRIYSKFRRIYFYYSYQYPFEEDWYGFGLKAQPYFFESHRLLQWSFLTTWPQLEEVHLWSISLEGDYRLALPNLKVLQVEMVFRGILTLDTPQLSQLRIYSIDSFDRDVALVHPETVETLRITCRSLFLFGDHDEVLTTFIGLKSLVLENYYPRGILLSEGVLNLERYFAEMILNGKLKEIHFWSIPSGALLDLRDRKWRNFRSIMRRLKEQAKELRIFFSGLEFDRLRDQRDFEGRPRIHRRALLERDQLDTYLADPSMLSETLPFYIVRYDLVQNSIESHIFHPRKLVELIAVTVLERVNDELALAQWLKSLETLSEIRFGTKCGLSPEFFSSVLPAIRPNIERFRFYFRQPLDYSFLLKFKFLCSAYFTCLQPDYGLIELLFPNLAHLKYLAFSKRTGQPSRGLLRTVKLKNYDEYHLDFFVNENENGTRVFQSFESFVQFIKQLNLGD